MKHVVLAIVIVIITVIAVALHPWITLWLGFSIMPNPPEPSVIISEFDFELKYELNGNTIVIDDKVICEFAGYNARTEAGLSRKWKVTAPKDVAIQDDGEEDSLLIKLIDLSKENEYDEFGRKILELYFYGGSGHYYMSDVLGGHNRDEQEFDYISYRYITADGDIGHSSIPADEAYKKFKIRLVSWEASSPIENEFK